MKYYSYRLLSLSEQLLRNSLRGNDLFYIDQETAEKDTALEWAMDMEDDLEELKKRRKGAAVRSRARIANYREAVVLAFVFAWEYPLDIVFTDHADEFSMIVLHGGGMLFDRKDKAGKLKMLHQLEDAADELYFAASEDASGELRLNVQFIFDLFEPVQPE